MEHSAGPRVGHVSADQAPDGGSPWCPPGGAARPPDRSSHQHGSAPSRPERSCRACRWPPRAPAATTVPPCAVPRKAGRPWSSGCRTAISRGPARSWPGRSSTSAGASAACWRRRHPRLRSSPRLRARRRPALRAIWRRPVLAPSATDRARALSQAQPRRRAFPREPRWLVIRSEKHPQTWSGAFDGQPQLARRRAEVLGSVEHRDDRGSRPQPPRVGGEPVSCGGGPGRPAGPPGTSPTCGTPPRCRLRPRWRRDRPAPGCPRQLRRRGGRSPGCPPPRRGRRRR